MAQTTVTDRNTVRTGSAKIEIGERLDKLVDIGAARSVSVKETLTTTDIESDNAGVISTIVSEHKIEITCDSLEINLSKYASMRGGIDKFTEYDGKTEIDRKYNVVNDTYVLNEIITVPFKNADGSNVVIDYIEVDNGSAVRDLDTSEYEAIGTNAIKITASSVTPYTDTLIIYYKQTPKAMKRLTTGGGASSIKPQWVKITNTDANKDEFRIICPQASISGGLSFPFPADDATDVMVNSLSFSATVAATEDEYEQLAHIEDEQAVAQTTNDDAVVAPTEPVVDDEPAVDDEPVVDNVDEYNNDEDII